MCGVGLFFIRSVFFVCFFVTRFCIYSAHISVEYVLRVIQQMRSYYLSNKADAPSAPIGDDLNRHAGEHNREDHGNFEVLEHNRHK